MTVPTFTPGDWIADEKRLVIETADHALDVAQVFDDGSCPVEQVKADLHVLAASKRLYVAARAALAWFDAAYRGVEGGSALDAADALKAALAAAEGR